MKITSDNVQMYAHSSFKEQNFINEKFLNFKDTLLNNQPAKLENIPTVLKQDNFNSDLIIYELSQAILKNLLLLRSQMRKSSYELCISSYEYESMDFKTKACVKTTNKEIEVDINLSLKRSFVSKVNVDVSSIKNVFSDPLILNLENSLPSLSQKTFSFDIDSDGKSDQISLLAKNSAFLVLDKNKNMQIDHADELFGALSGDGFAELRVFDEDNNNWIDENDKIFNKLQIWKKHEDEDRLIGLGEAGIGAIYLGNKQTDFSLNSKQNNKALGKLRRSGFFLKEDGTSGVISQIDLALQNKTSTSEKRPLLIDNYMNKTSKNKEKIFNILMEYIRQLEVKSIKTDEKTKLLQKNGSH